MTINTKHHDTETPLTVNADLSGSTVRVLVRPRRTDDVATELDSTVVSATAGSIVADTSGLDVGAYDLEVEVTQAGKVYTFPSTGYEPLYVNADLG